MEYVMSVSELHTMELEVGQQFQFPFGICRIRHYVGFPANSIVSITKIDDAYVWLHDNFFHHKMPVTEFQNLQPETYFIGYKAPAFTWHPDGKRITSNPYIICPTQSKHEAGNVDYEIHIPRGLSPEDLDLI